MQRRRLTMLSKLNALDQKRSGLMSELNKSMALRKAFNLGNDESIIIRKKGTVYDEARGLLECSIFYGDELVSVLTEKELNDKLG
jgi:hypothetical protein